MLTKAEILKRMADDEIVISPFNPEHLGANSYDLTLSPRLLYYDCKPYGPRTFPGMTDWRDEHAEWIDVLDMKEEPAVCKLQIPAEGLVLVPGRLYLGSTTEHTETYGLVPGIEGRSSVGRLGISIHATAGFGDIGFRGTWTLEISVIHPVRVYAGVRICQIYYHDIRGEHPRHADYSETGRYQNQRGPQPSRLWRDFE